MASLTQAGAPSTSEAPAPEPTSEDVSLLPEVEMYAYLLVLLLLVDAKQYESVKELAALAVDRLSAFNRRTLDVIAARIVFYLSLGHERTGTLDSIRR